MLPMPAPLPDEFVTGHAGRLFILNKIPRTRRSLSQLRVLTGQAPGMNYLEVMAKLSQITTEQYAYSHTLAPFYLAVHSKRAVSWKTAPPSRRQLMISARKGTATAVRLCPKCVEEDKNFWGYSYWRRSHQFPGVTWCSKHQCALRLAPASAPLLHLPEEVIAEGASSNSTDCEVAKRYGAICADFLQRDASVSTRAMTQLLQEQAERKLIRSRAGLIKAEHLDDIARLQCDPVWLREHFPDVFTKERSSSLCRTYSSVTVAYGTQYYALALALLFDYPDEAMLPLCSAQARISLVDTAAPLSRAMKDLCAGMPLLKAMQQHGAQMEDLERLLRVSFSGAQQPLSLGQA